MYISPLDILDITLDELIDIDEKKIIRLEKRLKILKLQDQENFFNQETTDNLINQLKDKEKKEAIIFIEKHPNFKAFISNGTDNGPKTFFFTQSSLNNITPVITSFLEPYLEHFFIPLLKNNYKKNKYHTIIEALKAKKLFSEALLLKCYNYIIQQANILNKTILNTAPAKLFEKKPQVTYRSYIKLLNLVPLGIIKPSKIDYVNALLNYYNKTKKNNKEFPKIKQAYRLIAEITIDEPDLEEQLREISSIGSSKGYYNSDNPSDSNMIRIAVFFLIILVTIVRLSNSNNSKKNNSYNTNTYDFKKNINKQKKENILSQNRFIKNLYTYVTKIDSGIISKKLLNIKTGEEPYNEFISRHHFPNNSKTKINNDSILIENNSNKSLILFTKNKSESLKSAIFINKKDSLKIPFTKNCEFIFYLGKKFSEVSSKNKTKMFFTEVSQRDKEYLLQKFILSSKAKNKKITIENSIINFHELNNSISKNIGVIKLKAIENKKKKINTSYRTTPVNKNWKKNKKSFFTNLNIKLPSRLTKRIAYNLVNGQNPYPKYFRSYKNSGISGYPVLIKNNTHKHVIVFNRNLENSRDFATYIKPKKELTIYLYEEGDTLYFNKGDYFYKYNKIKRLKMDNHDRSVFSTPIIIKGFLEGSQIININDHNIEPLEILY